MRFNYNNFANLEQLVKDTLIEAEQAIRSVRGNSLRSPAKNSQTYRAEPCNNVPAPDKAPQTAGADASTGRTADAEIKTGAGTQGTLSAGKKAPDDYSWPLKFNFNKENILSGIVMSEVLGRPKCLRRGRW